MLERTINLQGFEEALVAEISARFRYAVTGITDKALVAGRNLFADDMPERESIQKTTTEFNPKTEPVIAIYNPGGASVGATISSSSKHEWNLRVVLRFGTVFEAAKQLLEILVEWLEGNLRGRTLGRHFVKGVFIANRPAPFQRTGDNAAYCTATVRILGVPA